MKEILLIVFSDLRNDARMQRHLAFISKDYKVTACCIASAPTNDYDLILLQNTKLTLFRKAISAGLLLLKRFSWAYNVLYPYKAQLSHLKSRNFDLIIANDIEALPLAFELKVNKTKILFDAHEYAPRHFEDKLWWRIFFMDFNNFLCKKFIPQTDAMITIGYTIANEYKKHFGVTPTVITNSTYYQDFTPTRKDSKEIKLVHHGIVNSSRKIELIIEIIKHLPEYFSLDLILVVPATASGKTLEYLNYLKELSSAYKNVRFIDPVPVNKITSVLNDYDMGIILAPPINFNYANGLPNKLFDFIQARIGVLTGPTPEIAKIVNNYDIGIVSDGFTSESFAEKVILLTRDRINAFKENCHKAAHELSAENNRATILTLVESLTSKS